MVDGLTVLKHLRAAQPNLPVVVLTAQDGLSGRVTVLNAGADDFITKPFDFPELEARLRALMRRALRSATLEVGFGRLAFERESRRISVSGQVFDLSPREWTLLDLLAAQRDRVVTKELIAQACCGLGLSIVKEIVERHGGQVTLEALKPHGLRVVLRLPLSRSVQTLTRGGSSV